MATTPIYAIPTPDLGSTADGPSAMAAMATRIETVMTKFISETAYYGGTTSIIGTGGNTLVHEVTYASSHTGWLQVSLGVVELGEPGANAWPAVAGFVVLYINDVQKRQCRFHNYSRAALWTSGNIDTMVPVSGSTSTNIKVRVQCDGSSNPVQFFFEEMLVRSFGTP